MLDKRKIVRAADSAVQVSIYKRGSMMIGWLYLALGVIGEVTWVMTLKATEGFSKLWPSILNLGVAFFNILVLSKAFNVLPTILAYSIWVGISAAAIAMLAWGLQGESLSAAKIGCIVLIIVGVIGLKSFDGADKDNSAQVVALPQE